MRWAITIWPQAIIWPLQCLISRNSPAIFSLTAVESFCCPSPAVSMSVV